MIAARHSEIPSGLYCYGYVPAVDSGFHTVEEVNHFVSTLPEDEQVKAHFRLFQRKFCPHRKPLEGSRVECTHLGIRAEFWGREAKARAYYRAHPDEEHETPLGFMLGDAIKECNLNMDGPDFTIPY